MQDLNKKFQKIVEDSNKNKLGAMSNVSDKLNFQKKAVFNKKKILYGAILGLVLVNTQSGNKAEASTRSAAPANRTCSATGSPGYEGGNPILNYTLRLDCPDINRQMRGHFSSENHRPDRECHSYVNGHEGDWTWATPHSNHTQGHGSHSSSHGGGDVHTNSQRGTCTMQTNESYRYANALTFNHNGGFRMDVIYDAAPNLQCKVNPPHGSHGSHGSHASHASHGSHGSHGSHASHGSHSSHSNASSSSSSSSSSSGSSSTPPEPPEEPDGRCSESMIDKAGCETRSERRRRHRKEENPDMTPGGNR